MCHYIVKAIVPLNIIVSSCSSRIILFVCCVLNRLLDCLLCVMYLDRSCAIIYYSRSPHYNISLICRSCSLICVLIHRCTCITCALCHIHCPHKNGSPHATVLHVRANTYTCVHLPRIVHLDRIMCTMYYTTNDLCVHP
jgi:hypothetical protein